MIDLILGIIATLICGFGYGTLFFFTSVFWTWLLMKLVEYRGVSIAGIEVTGSIDKDNKEEKT